MGQVLTAREAADRLGVELATIYAYASRGALTRSPAGDGRRSLYDADEVEALARRARPRSARRRIAAVDVVIGTTVSEIGDGWIRYRGTDLLDLVELAGDRGFEAVCSLLWTGSLDPGSWARAANGPGPLELGGASGAHPGADPLPANAPVRSRLAVGAAVAGAHLAGSGDDGHEPMSAGPMVIDALVRALPFVEGVGRAPAEEVAAHARTTTSVAQRLWPRLSPLPCTPRRARALDVALVVLAEHELATSTLAARLAASTRAGPGEIVAAGLATLSGPLHGRAAVRVHRRLLEATAEALDSPTATMGDGLGHVVHRRGDPRFAPLLAEATAIATPAQRRQISAVLAVSPRGPQPNVDAALAALAFAAGADVGATEAIFAIARTAGWLAHGWEEIDEPPLRYRGRTLYRGPRSAPPPS